MAGKLGVGCAGPLVLRDVVQAIGSDDFGARLCATLHEQLGIEQLVVFQAAGPAPWRTLIAQNVRNTADAERLASAYTRHFWSRDPKRAALRSLRPKQAELQASEDLRATDAEYRKTLFVEPDLVDKLSLFFRGEIATYYVNLYRGRSAGIFLPGDFRRVQLTGDFLSALVEKHAMLVEPTKACSVSQVEVLLRAIQQQRRVPLSPREIQTCARVALGFSSEAIASDLGVSVHSAITFRKRAFSKLGIATHQELFALVLQNRRHLDR